MGDWRTRGWILIGIGCLLAAIALVVMVLLGQLLLAYEPRRDFNGPALADLHRKRWLAFAFMTALLSFSLTAIVNGIHAVWRGRPSAALQNGMRYAAIVTFGGIMIGLWIAG